MPLTIRLSSTKTCSENPDGEWHAHCACLRSFPPVRRSERRRRDKHAHWTRVLSASQQLPEISSRSVYVHLQLLSAYLHPCRSGDTENRHGDQFLCRWSAAWHSPAGGELCAGQGPAASVGWNWQ